MATLTQINKFISEIGPCAVNAYKEYGKVLPSVCIGMACVESAYGTAGSAKHHSYIGQKVGTGRTATKNWSKKFFTTKTLEEYTVGTHTVINAAFRAYDSMQQCVLNYYELLNTSLYKKVKAKVDYKTQMQQIKEAGYMTSSTEVNSVIKIIEKYNLTDWDILKTNDNPYPEPTKIISISSKGSGVKWVQYELNRRGAGLKVDGDFGEKTLEAVKNFQQEHNLEVDGVVGRLTRNEIKKYLLSWNE